MKKLLLSFACLTQLATAENAFIDKNQPTLEIRVFSGLEAQQYFDDIANMRITLFKEFPYLYQGSIAYEEEYLETYFKSPNATILLVFDNNKVVGFSNSIPLAEESDAMKAPFIAKGLDLNNYLYIGEVMLYSEYRGQGILRSYLVKHVKKSTSQPFL